LRSREDIDKREREWLAPWGQPAVRSRGRLFPEPPHAYRTEFQRDRDRITHARAFRRLQHKMQVFAPHEGDHFRNRLTHTLEVSQIARTIARALGANEDLTEAIVLAHDLGHPPFGHAGEQVLHGLLAAHGGFEHNRQSLRTVDLIERRSPHYRGLNLTLETRAGLLKHGSRYPRYAHPVPLPPLGRQPSIEAQIANLADSIAYHAHDIDDGLRAELLRWEELWELELWRRALDRRRDEVRGADPVSRQRATVALIDLLVSDLIEHSGRALAGSGVRSPEEVLERDGAWVGLSPELERARGALADYLLEHVYRHPAVLRMTARAGRVLRDLWEAYTSDPHQLPPGVLERDTGEARERAIADYIAGMTDRFALDEHRKLLDPRVAST
jgi:dGTPase